MKTRRTVVSLLAGPLAVTVIAWGCNKQNTANGSAAQGSTPTQPEGPSVAIVEYQKVLRDMGWQSKVEVDLKTYRERMVQELNAFNAHYSQQISDLQKSMGKDPTPLQQQQLTQTAIAAQQTLKQMQAQANEMLQAYQSEWGRRYREALAPLVRQAAQKGNYKLVLAQSDFIAFSEPAIDLTNAVVDGAKAQPPTIVDVPMTQLQGPDKVGPNMSAPTTGPATRSSTTIPSPTTGP
jgi:outer membrane protein